MRAEVGYPGVSLRKRSVAVASRPSSAEAGMAPAKEQGGGGGGERPYKRRMGPWNVFVSENSGGRCVPADWSMASLSSQYRSLSLDEMKRLRGKAESADSAKEAGNPWPLQSGFGGSGVGGA